MFASCIYIGLVILNLLMVFEPIDDDCSCKDIKLYGKVEIVESFGDIKVEVVDEFADLNVEIVDAFPTSCGKWEIVDSFGDFKVEFVEQFGDIKVKFITGGYPGGFPGKK